MGGPVHAQQVVAPGPVHRPDTGDRAPVHPRRRGIHLPQAPIRVGDDDAGRHLLHHGIQQPDAPRRDARGHRWFQVDPIGRVWDMASSGAVARSPAADAWVRGTLPAGMLRASLLRCEQRRPASMGRWYRLPDAAGGAHPQKRRGPAAMIGCRASVLVWRRPWAPPRSPRCYPPSGKAQTEGGTEGAIVSHQGASMPHDRRDFSSDILYLGVAQRECPLINGSLAPRGRYGLWMGATSPHRYLRSRPNNACLASWNGRRARDLHADLQPPRTRRRSSVGVTPTQ